MGKLSREKGKRGERQVVDLLKKHGFEAHRGQQFKGTKDSPDVIHNMTGFCIEVKLREKFNLYEALEKTEQEAPKGEDAIVFHRKNGKKWLITMDADDFLSLTEELYND